MIIDIWSDADLLLIIDIWSDVDKLLIIDIWSDVDLLLIIDIWSDADLFLIIDILFHVDLLLPILWGWGIQYGLYRQSEGSSERIQGNNLQVWISLPGSSQQACPACSGTRWRKWFAEIWHRGREGKSLSRISHRLIRMYDQNCWRLSASVVWVIYVIY